MAVLDLRVVESLSLSTLRTNQNGELDVVGVFLVKPFSLFGGKRTAFDDVAVEL